MTSISAVSRRSYRRASGVPARGSGRRPRFILAASPPVSRWPRRESDRRCGPGAVLLRYLGRRRAFPLTEMRAILAVAAFTLAVGGCSTRLNGAAASASGRPDSPAIATSSSAQRVGGGSSADPGRVAHSSAEPASSQGPTRTSQGGSGMEGVTVAGPSCPIVAPGSSCADRPVAAELVVRDASGKEVLRFKSGADGRFRVDLPPGQYTLGSPEPLALPFTRPQTVTVIGGQYINVGNVHFDTGIR